MPDARYLPHWSLDPTIRYLNHGSFGATPTEILSVQSILRAEMEREPVQFLGRNLPERIDQARQALASFLHATPANLAFVPNATSAVNTVLRSIAWQTGDEILITDHTYNACRNVVDHVVAHHGLRLSVAALPFPIASEEEALTAIENGISRNTRLALIDHVTSPTALVLPIERIVRLLGERGIDTLVDGAHAPGMLPLDLEEIGAAYYTGNLHKWVCAPKGAAFLHVQADRQQGLLPAVISHGLNTSREGSTSYQDLFDWPGTFDPTAWLSVPAAMEFMGGLLPGGWTELRLHQHKLLLAARDLLTNQLELEKPCPNSMLGSMTTLPLPRLSRTARSLKELQYQLFDHYRIELPLVAHGGSEWFRISAQIYNSTDDYEALLEALAEEA